MYNNTDYDVPIGISASKPNCETKVNLSVNLSMWKYMIIKRNRRKSMLYIVYLYRQSVNVSVLIIKVNS